MYGGFTQKQKKSTATEGGGDGRKGGKYYIHVEHILVED